MLLVIEWFHAKNTDKYLIAKMMPKALFQKFLVLPDFGKNFGMEGIFTDEYFMRMAYTRPYRPFDADEVPV